MVFTFSFIPLYRLFSETGISQQKMIRDYAVAINIAENAMNLIESEIDLGNIPIAVSDQDISELIFGNVAVQSAIQKMLGYGADSATKYMPVFRLFLTARPFQGNADLMEIRLKFVWGNKGAGTAIDGESSFELKTLRTRM